MRRLVVENVGPVRFAELELPRVSVVVGGNGSGKTTLATIHYLTLFQEAPEVAEEDVVTLEVGEGYVEVDLREHLDVVCGYVKGLIRRLFQTEPGRLISQGEASAAVRVEAGGVRLEVALERGGSVACDLAGAAARRFEVKVVETGPGPLVVWRRDRVEVVGKVGGRVDVPGVVYAVLRQIFGEGWVPAAFLPTERLAVVALMPLLQREIWAFPPAPYKPLIFDFLRWAPPGEYEEPLLGLRFRVERPGRIVGVVHKGEEIPPSLVASGSAQFAAVAMAASSPGVASLIIEEPELNLHVDAQLKAAEYLASLSHRLFITTHSDLFAIALVHHLKRRGRLGEVKIYELVRGEASEVPIDERGAVGEFKTITPIELKAVEQFLEDLA
ncbi:hypothetical protein PYWP30_01064 [Pyrobaculum sp. WP30]|nr:hypothetical protein PYWP30_01064 [Pyrobaculum sp. WP30]